VAVGVEVPVLLDVAAVEVGHALGRAEGDVDQEGHGPRFARRRSRRNELAERLRDVGVRGEDLVEERVRAAVGLHHVEHHLVDAVRTEEPVDVEHVGQVAVGDDRGRVQLHAEALHLRDRVQPGDGLLEALGRARQPLVQLLRVAVDGDVEAVHPGLRHPDGVRHVREAPAVGHHADAAVAQLLGPLHEVGKLGAGGGLAAGEAHLLGAAVLLEDPADALGRHRAVVDLARVAVFLHAEDAVVVADRADGDVQPLFLRLDALDDGGVYGQGHG
jgi:hypothetical protein